MKKYTVRIDSEADGSVTAWCFSTDACVTYEKGANAQVATMALYNKFVGLANQGGHDFKLIVAHKGLPKAELSYKKIG